MNEEEKDLYIKAKLKNGKIPEKIDDLFNNSIKIIENKGVEDMEENSNLNMNQNNQNKPEKKKMPVALKRVLATAACLTVALGGGNLYATSQGYDNIFFLIKHVVTGEDVRGKENILTDRDITISYRPIEITKGTQIQVNSLVIKDNEAKLKVQVKETDLEELTTPLKYIIKDEKGKELYTDKSDNSKILLCGDANCDGKVNGDDLEILRQYLAGSEVEITEDGKTNLDMNADGEIDTVDLSVLRSCVETSEELENDEDAKYRELHYKEELILNGFKEDTKKLILEIYDTNSKKLADLEIDLESKAINVIGNQEELTKISEEELKEYLGAFATIGYKGKDVKATTLDEQKILVALRIAENNMIDLYTGEKEYNDTGFNLVLDREKVHKMIKSFTTLELNEEGNIEDNEMLYASRIKGKLQYIDTSWTSDFEPTCLEVTDIAYVGGIYNVTFKFCYSTESEKNFTSITTVEDLPVYEMTMGLILDENSEYSKYRISTISEAVLVKEGKNDNINNLEQDITDEKVANIIQGYLNISSSNEATSYGMLTIKEIGLATEEELNQIRNTGERDEEGYAKTNIKFADLKNKMMEYMTEQAFERFTYAYKDVDGDLWIIDTGASGYSNKVESVKQISSLGDTITYEVLYTTDAFDGRTTNNQQKFELKKNNQGKYVVSVWGEILESREKAKEQLQNYVDLLDAYESSPACLLEKLNLLANEGEYGENEYWKTEVEFENYKSAMLDYVSENWFNEMFSTLYNKSNDQYQYLHFQNSGSSVGTNKVESIAIKGNLFESTYIATVYTVYSDGVKGDIYNVEFSLETFMENDNKKTVISYCDELKY